MNLKSAAMATGLVLTFAAGAWLSTIMLAPPQRPNRMAVQEQPPAPSPSASDDTAAAKLAGTAAGHGGVRLHPAAASAIAPGTRRDTSGADACRRSACAKRPHRLIRNRHRRPNRRPLSRRNLASRPPPPKLPPPWLSAAAGTAACSRGGGRTGTAGGGNPIVPVVETTPEADIDPGIAALSDLVTRAPSILSAPTVFAAAP